MKRKMIGLLAAASCMVVAQNASAVDFGIIPRASVGYEHLSIDWQENAYNMADLDLNLVTGTIGATATVDKFYFDVYVAHSLEASDEDTLTPIDISVDWDVDVFDAALTAGYNVWKSLAVYAGWKWHTTDMDGSISIPANWRGAGNAAIPNALNMDNEISYNGPFIGVSYGWKIGESNLLSVNAAYAWMSANMDLTISTTNGNYSEKLPTADSDDDASGLTLGIAWKGYLTDALSYGISADWYKYSYNFVAATSSNEDFEEEAYSLKFTISYDF